jgi:hypothetical protein
VIVDIRGRIVTRGLVVDVVESRVVMDRKERKRLAFIVDQAPESIHNSNKPGELQEHRTQFKLSQ